MIEKGMHAWSISTPGPLVVADLVDQYRLGNGLPDRRRHRRRGDGEAARARGEAAALRALDRPDPPAPHALDLRRGRLALAIGHEFDANLPFVLVQSEAALTTRASAAAGASAAGGGDGHEQLFAGFVQAFLRDALTGLHHSAHGGVGAAEGRAVGHGHAR